MLLLMHVPFRVLLRESKVISDETETITCKPEMIILYSVSFISILP